MTGFTIGVDIGGTNTRFGLVDRAGKLHKEGRFATTDHDKAEDFATALAQGIRTCVGDQEPDVCAVGIGAPNANYHRGTVEHAPNLAWKGVVPLAELVRDALGWPVWITNDANAAAIGEKLYGDAQGLDDFLVVTLGTGVGSGFVCGGKVLYGATGFAGELGHVIVDPNGRPCGCGRRGCLETYASVTGFQKTAHEKLGRKLTGEQVFEAARKGDKLALEVYAETGAVLGKALANAAAITSPAAIFLFGGLAGSGDLILEPTRDAFEQNLLPILRDTVELAISGLQDQNAAILGAAAFAWQEWEACHA